MNYILHQSCKYVKSDPLLGGKGEADETILFPGYPRHISGLSCASHVSILPKKARRRAGRAHGRACGTCTGIAGGGRTKCSGHRSGDGDHRLGRRARARAGAGGLCGGRGGGGDARLVPRRGAQGAGRGGAHLRGVQTVARAGRDTPGRRPVRRLHALRGLCRSGQRRAGALGQPGGRMERGGARGRRGHRRGHRHLRRPADRRRVPRGGRAADGGGGQRVGDGHPLPVERGERRRRGVPGLRRLRDVRRGGISPDSAAPQPRHQPDRPARDVVHRHPVVRGGRRDVVPHRRGVVCGDGGARAAGAQLHPLHRQHHRHLHHLPHGGLRARRRHEPVRRPAHGGGGRGLCGHPAALLQRRRAVQSRGRRSAAAAVHVCGRRGVFNGFRCRLRAATHCRALAVHARNGFFPA